MNSDTDNIFVLFNSYFEMMPATTDELKKESYKLRYHIYCLETGFENPEQYPDGMEYDDDDVRSVHYLIRHRKSGEYAATVRLILPYENRPDELLPIEKHFKFDNVAVTQAISRQHLGEVSRFCVSKSFKRRRNEADTLTSVSPYWEQDYFTTGERRTFPYIVFSLMACIIKASREHNIDYLYGTMETPWLRFLAASGLHWVKIGPAVDYHGERWPCAVKITDVLDHIAKKDGALWNMLTNNGQF